MCERVDLGDGNFAIVCGGRRMHKKSEAIIHFPATAQQLKAAGWKAVYSRSCKLCRNPLEFWQKPEGKPMPLEAIQQDGVWMLASHWATCPFADKFRKPEKQPTEKQLGLFGEQKK
jgi:hypothetical protein